MGNVLLFFLLSLILEVVFCESEVLSVKAGDSVTLHTDSQIQTGDVIYWWFGLENKLIARINKAAKTSKLFEDELDGKFKGRLKLGQTNDLIITNVMTTDSGHFEVSNEDGVKKSFNVSVVSVDFTKTVSVLEGDLVTLHTDDPDIKIYNAIQWRFEHQISPVAEIKPGNVPKYDKTDKRLQGKLQLDPQTGSLTIKDIRAEQAGLYEVDIISSGHTVHKSYNVFVGGVSRSVVMKNTGESVTLHTDANLQDYDFTLWSFEGTDLAEIFKADNRFSTYSGPDGKFRGRLKLDEQTGDLTITEAVTTDTGQYDLKIISSRHTIHKKFTVAVNSPGWSSGAIALTVLLCIILLAVAIGAARWYRRHMMPNLNLQLYEAKTEFMKEGDTVTLQTDHQLWEE